MFAHTLRAPKKRSADWSAILNSLPNEISKREAVSKIVQIFPITESEAEELVERTPVILLESLTEEDALKLKHFFVESQIDVSISNDSSVRKKCYRTVWPEQPSLDFLQAESFKNDSGHSFSSPEPQAAAEKAHEPVRMPATSISTPAYGTKGRPELIYSESSAKDVPLKERIPMESERNPAADIAARDRIIDELKDKLFSVQKQVGYLKESNEKLEHSLLAAQKEKSERLLRDQEDVGALSFDSISLEQEKKYALMEEQIERLGKERDRMSGELTQFKSTVQELRAGVSKLESDRNRISGAYEELSKTVAAREKEVDQLRMMLKDHRHIEEEHKQVRVRLDRLASENEELRERYRALEEDKRTQDVRLAELANESERLRKEREIEIVQFQKEQETLRRKVKDAETYAADNQRLQGELEQTRERLRELTVNREQQEAITKRLRLQNELIEREARLKELVKKQEIIEREIVERGQVIQQVLSEQEEIEREIVRAKQAQKYLTEQIKAREKPRLKSRGRLEFKSPESAADAPVPSETETHPVSQS